MFEVLLMLDKFYILLSSLPTLIVAIIMVGSFAAAFFFGMWVLKKLCFDNKNRESFFVKHETLMVWLVMFLLFAIPIVIFGASGI